MATTAETMKAKYAELLEANAGLRSVTVDGQTISFADLEQKYLFWCKRVELDDGTRAPFVRVNLTSFQP